jgi:hypothetical protein
MPSETGVHRRFMAGRLDKRMFRRGFLVFCAVLALGLSQAQAQGRYARDPYGPYGQNVQPLDRILPQIRHGYPGTFYDAEGPYPDEAGNPHYHIKWMTPDGRVVWLDTDARTGRVLGVRGSGWRAQQFHAMPYGNRFGPPPPNLPPPGWNRGGYYGGYPRGHRGH